MPEEKELGHIGHVAGDGEVEDLQLVAIRILAGTDGGGGEI